MRQLSELHGFAGVQQAFGLSQILDIDRTHACFDNHVHTFFIDFQNAVHPFHQQDDAMIYRHGAAADAGAGASRRNGNVVLVGDLDDFGTSSVLAGSTTTSGVRQYDGARLSSDLYTSNTSGAVLTYFSPTTS
mgnify:CR=1 FL=1